jgi:hypothetical protein
MVRRATERLRLPPYGSHVGRNERLRTERGCTMSVNARTITGTKTGITWTGAWIATILLALLFAVSLFAMDDRGGQVVDRPPVSTGFVVGDQLSGGRGAVDPGANAGGGTQWRPIQVGGSVCHQCR